MDSYYSESQYKSANFILNSYSSEIFDGITLLMRPVVGGIDYLRSMRRAFRVQMELNKISSWSFETREKLLDELTDVIAGKTINENFVPELESKLSEFDEVEETFQRLNQLTKSLEPKHMLTILTLSLNKLNGKITSIRNEINLKMWDKNENVNELLVLDQFFYLIQELTNQALKNVSSFKKTPDSEELWTVIVFSLLYIEAFHRSKVTLEKLQDYISELNLFCYREENIPKNQDVVFEVLTA